MRLNYAVVGTNDMAAAKGFYDALFDGTGVKSFAPSDRMTYWMGADFAFAAATPFDTQPATVGNGTRPRRSAMRPLSVSSAPEASVT